MRFIKVGGVELSVIKTVIREKGADIGRPELGNVNGSEIKVLELSQSLPNKKVYICYVRGMSYKVDTNAKCPSIAIFDPQTICTGKGCSVKRSPSYISSQ